MPKLTFTECFAKYRATLINPMWAVSSHADDNSIVISCWSNYFSHPDKQTLRYTDKLSRWEGNALGNNLLRQHLLLAQKDSLPIRLVIATAQNALEVDQGWDASKIPKTFHVRPDLTGHLSHFDGDAFWIDFRKT